jgi:lycopene beta-cyclase
VSVDRHTFDHVLVGGGLQNGLIALALLARRPGSRIALIEREPHLGGNHTWSFFGADVPPEARPIVEPLVAHRWSGYRVAFPGLTRELDEPYFSTTGETLDAVVRPRLAAAPGCLVITGVDALHVGAREVTLADGRRLEGRLVVDARGPGRAVPPDAGFQKFVGLEVTLERPTLLTRPVVMDACVEQHDGFRFVYVLPLAPDRLLVEDTYFSDSPALDVDTLRGRALAYLRARGDALAEVVRVETGVLPMPWGGPHPVAAAPLAGGYQGGWFHPATGYSFAVALRLALHVSAHPPEAVLGPELGQLVAEHRRRVVFARTLNRLLFRGVKPQTRWQIFRRFYGLPEDTIRRFYALTPTATDGVRILFGGGVPPGISLTNLFNSMRTR